MIIHADDEESILGLVGAQLRALGFNVISFNDGAGAVDFLRSQHDREIHAVITDLRMTTVHGDAVAGAAKSRNCPPLVLMTTGTPPESPIPGVDHMIEKPFKLQQLLDILSPRSSQ